MQPAAAAPALDLFGESEPTIPAPAPAAAGTVSSPLIIFHCDRSARACLLQGCGNGWLLRQHSWRLPHRAPPGMRSERRRPQLSRRLQGRTTGRGCWTAAAAARLPHPQLLPQIHLQPWLGHRQRLPRARTLLQDQQGCHPHRPLQTPLPTSAVSFPGNHKICGLHKPPPGVTLAASLDVISFAGIHATQLGFLGACEAHVDVAGVQKRAAGPMPLAPAPQKPVQDPFATLTSASDPFVPPTPKVHSPLKKAAGFGQAARSSDPFAPSPYAATGSPGMLPSHRTNAEFILHP